MHLSGTELWEHCSSFTHWKYGTIIFQVHGRTTFQKLYSWRKEPNCWHTELVMNTS